MTGAYRKWRFRGADGRREEVAVNGSLIISSLLSLRQAALDGLGPALLVDWMVDDEFSNGTLVNLLPDW